MAKLLYRIGQFAARRAWAVLLVWAVLLASAVGAYLSFGGTLSDSVTIPGTKTEQVTKQLAKDLPELSGGSASVVFQAEGGFTDEQKAQLATLFEKVGSLPAVKGVVDPFQTEAQRASQAEQLASGTEQIAAGRQQLAPANAQIAQSEQQLESGAAQLAAGKQQLDGAIAQMQAAGIDPNSNPQLAAQRAQLEQAQQQYDAGKAQLEQGKAQLAEQTAKLDAAERKLAIGQELLQYAKNARLVSEDGSTAVLTVSLEKQSYELTSEQRDAIVTELENGLPSGVKVYFSQQLAQTMPELVGAGEVIGLVVALIVLLVLMRAVLPAVVPVLSAVVGVGVGVAAALSLSGVVDMMSVTPVLGIMLGLAVGIDYSLFIINRHRKQLLQGVPMLESIGLANGTSGNAVLFAGVTVIIALVALGTTGVPFLGTMGYVAAFCVAIAVLIAVTLTPAFLGLMGMRVVSIAERKRAANGETRQVKELRPMSKTRAALSVVLPIIALSLIALPAMQMTLGLPTGKSESEHSTQHQAYVAIDKAFGEGQNATLLVVAHKDAITADSASDAELQSLENQVAVAKEITGMAGVSAVAPAAQNEQTGTYAFQVIPKEGQDADSTRNLVQELRDAGYGVAGNASAAIDVSVMLQQALPGYLTLVVGFSLLVLVMVFRSILVPLIATAGFVLSLLATLGAMTAIYQLGFLADVFGVAQPSAIIAFLPTVIVGILFGLAMDYQLFIASGMREAFVHGTPARLAVQEGLRLGRSVVIAAALIMMSVFGGFIFSHTTMIRPIGFALAFGVLVDAFIVRLVMMPALVHLAGDKAWWLPKWLDKMLPNLDVEGESLQRQHSENTAVDKTA